ILVLKSIWFAEIASTSWVACCSNCWSCERSTPPLPALPVELLSPGTPPIVVSSMLLTNDGPPCRRGGQFRGFGASISAPDQPIWTGPHGDGSTTNLDKANMPR